MSSQFWMSVAYWLRLKITVKYAGLKARGYVLTPCNQCGEFLLNTFPQDWRGDLLMRGRSADVVAVSLLADWRFKLREFAHRSWLDRMIKRKYRDFLGESHERYIRAILTFSFISDCLNLIQRKRYRIPSKK